MSAPPRALMIQHDHICTPGAVGERLEQRGYEVSEHFVVPAEQFHAPNVETTFPEPDGFDVIVAMGAPWSAYDHDAIGAWVLPELDLLRRAHAAGVGVLGICFGGQLLASAHGGSVSRSGSPELGWLEVSSDDDDLVPGGAWFQWHYDCWVVPPGAQEVARNPSASQAFVLGRNLAVQFHPEMDSEILQGWLDNGGTLDTDRFGIEQAALLAETARRDGANRVRAHRLVDAFLDQVAQARTTANGG